MVRVGARMTRIKVLIFALCFALLGSPIAAIASDISSALYYGTIIVSNNSTANTNVATVANISTANLISGGYLNSTANNTVMRNTSGADVPFMPAFSPSSDFWCFWIPSIGADTYLTYLLYTANSSGGELRYFPASGGMTIVDNASLEWGDDFESAFGTVWTDTTTNLELLKKRYSANIQNYESGLLGGMYYFEPVDVTPGVAGAWTDIDVSRYIPAGATGVILECDTNIIQNNGFRKNGSTDDRRTELAHGWIIVGVDTNLIFEAYLAVATTVYLFGYTDDSWTLNTNANDISIGALLAWTDIDLAALAPNATAVIIEAANLDLVVARNVGLRMKGSADARNNDIADDSHYFFVVGLDANQVLQGYIETADVDFYLVGYTTAGGGYDTNLTDKSLVGIGVWTDIDCAADAPNAVFLIFEIHNPPNGGQTFGFRANGSTHADINVTRGHGIAVVPCDDNQVVDGYIGNLAVDFFLIGYITSGQEQPYQTHALAASVSAAEHDIEVAIEAEPDMSLWASDVTVSVSMGQGILPVKLIFEETLTAPAASVTFSGITGNVSLWDSLAGVTSRHLVVMVNAATDAAVNQRDLALRFNGDAGNNYNYQYLDGAGAAASAARATGQNRGLPFPVPGTNYANAFGGGTIIIPHAFNNTNHKSTISIGGAVENSIFTSANRWASTDAIDSITLLLAAGNLITGSTFLLGVVDERYLVEEAINPAADFVVDFNNIPQTGHDLLVIGYPRSDRAAAFESINQQLNADAVGANYFEQKLEGSGVVTSASSANDQVIGRCSGDIATANAFGAFLANYSAYAESSNDVHALSLSGYHEDGGNSNVIAVSSRWNDVAQSAITRIQYIPFGGVNFKAGSLFSLYRVPRYVIDRQELTAPAATITFNNIPQNYQALQLNVYARTDVPGLGLATEIAFNTDVVAANYDTQLLQGLGAAVVAVRNAASRRIMAIPGTTEGANEFGGGIITFNQYSTTVGHKHYYSIVGRNENEVVIQSSRWEDTSAITRIDINFPGGSNFVAGSIFELVGLMPKEVFDITVDSEVKGLADGNFSAEANAEDWVIGGDGTPYLDTYQHTVSSVLRSSIQWRYSATFPDLSGNGNPATPTFRTASADADIIGNMTAFTPISQAQAPPFALGPTNPFITTAPNITGNFTTLPPVGTFPLAGVIVAISNATATPPQLPLLIIACFVILAASLTTSYTLRRFGSGSLIVKALVIIGFLGIFVALTDWGIDFWMVVIFSILATAIAMMSRQVTWR